MKLLPWSAPQLNATVAAILAAAVFLMAASRPLTAEGAAAGGELRWEDCVAMAKANHPDIISAREKIEQARANRGIERSSMLPQISTNLGVQRSKSDTGSGTGDNSAKNSYSYGIEGSQLLFDGGRAIFDTRGAYAQIRQAVYSGMETSATVRLNLRSAFIDLLIAQENVSIVKYILDRRVMNLNLVRMRHNAGREHRGSLMTAEVNLAQARAEYDQALRAISLYRHELAREMGLKRWEDFSVTGEIAVPLIARKTPDFNSLARHNPSVLQADTQIEYADYARKSTYSDYAPQVYGTASAGKSGDSWPPSESTWNAGVSLTLPLIKGGERIYQNSKAEAAYRQAVADRDSALSSASLALARKWTALLYAIDQCKVREKSLLASEERSRIAQARYNIGDITFDNWIIIENELVDAKKNYLNARASVLDAEAEWRNSQGVTLDNDTRE